MWGVCQESLSSFNIKTNQLSLVYLTNTYWVVTEVPGTGKTGQCVLDILYFPSPSKRWKTETKGGEEGGELWGAGWRGKITEQKRKKKEVCSIMAQFMGGTYTFSGFKRISSWKTYFSKGPLGNRSNDFLNSIVCFFPNILWWDEGEMFKHRKIQRRGTLTYPLPRVYS